MKKMKKKNIDKQSKVRQWEMCEQKNDQSRFHMNSLFIRRNLDQRHYPMSKNDYLDLQLMMKVSFSLIRIICDQIIRLDINTDWYRLQFHASSRFQTSAYDRSISLDRCMCSPWIKSFILSSEQNIVKRTSVIISNEKSPPLTRNPLANQTSARSANDIEVKLIKFSFESFRFFFIRVSEKNTNQWRHVRTRAMQQQCQQLLDQFHSKYLLLIKIRIHRHQKQVFLTLNQHLFWTDSVDLHHHHLSSNNLHFIVIPAPEEYDDSLHDLENRNKLLNDEVQQLRLNNQVKSIEFASINISMDHQFRVFIINIENWKIVYKLLKNSLEKNSLIFSVDQDVVNLSEHW